MGETLEAGAMEFTEAQKWQGTLTDGTAVTQGVMRARIMGWTLTDQIHEVLAAKQVRRWEGTFLDGTHEVEVAMTARKWGGTLTDPILEVAATLFQSQEGTSTHETHEVEATMTARK